MTRQAAGPRLVAALFVALAILPWAGGIAAAFEIEFAGQVVKRDILAIYDSKHEPSPSDTRIHRFTELPLNHLGYKLTYHDVNRPLPDPASLSGYRGLIAWFNEDLEKPEIVANWLDAATASGLRFALLGDIVPPHKVETDLAVNNILGRLGLEHSGAFVSLTHKAKVVVNNKDFIGFEKPVDKVIPDFPVVQAKGNLAKVHLSIDAPVDNVSATSVVVSTSERGGYAAQNFTFDFDPNTNRVRWILNPFAFFAAAFGDKHFPIPDTTTLAGRRLYFSHIDGDGWNNLSEIESYRASQTLSAEVIEREAIVPYSDLPVSVALLAGDIDISLGGNPKGRDIAKRLFALPQVEVASHTLTHPYDWQFFRNYSRADEERKIDQFQRPVTPMRQRFNAAILNLADKAVPANRFDKYVAGTDDLPRTYLKKPFDLQTEVQGALEISESLAPPGKKAKLYQWSGDTTPFPAAIEATRKAGARNINGGDSRLDWEYPSVAYVPPISRVTDAERQIYAVNSNENTYTNDWTGPYFGQFMLEHTLKNTDEPRRLKAFNLYYHMYSGEKASALAAVRYFLDMARNSEVIPVDASHYAAIADDFFNVRIEQIDLSSWAVMNRGAMQTVRFDNGGRLGIDYGRSSGVLGANRHAGSLYISLDPAVSRAVVTLKPLEDGVEKLGDLRAATLVSSRWLLSGLAVESCGFTVKAQGYGPGEMTWRAKAQRGFTILARRGDTVLSEETRWADKDGLLRLRLGLDAIEPLQLKVTCHE